MSRTITVLTFILTLMSPLSGERITLLVPDYPPFSPSGTKQGIWCEIVSRAFEVEGIKVTWTIYPIERANMMVRTGSALGVVNSEIAFTHDYGKTVFRGAPPFFWADVVAFYDSRRFPKGLGISSVRDLERYVTGALRGTGSVHVLQDGGIKLQISDSRESLALKLRIGRIDAMILGDLTGLETVKEYISEMEDLVKYESVYQSPINLIFSLQFPGTDVLAEKFRRGLEKIMADGSYLATVRSYYPQGNINPMVVPPNLRTRL